MTTPEAIKSIYLTYLTLRGIDPAKAEKIYKNYEAEFGKGPMLTNAAVMAFEINLQDSAAEKLRESLTELDNTGEIRE